MANPVILIIDDEKNFRFSLKDDLEANGFDVVLSDGQGDLIALVQDKNPDLVLLDIILQTREAGFDILKDIKNQDEEQLVMMMTQKDDIKSAIKAMKLGAYDYIHKPFNHDELILNIQKAFETRTLKREIGHIRQEQRKKYKLASIIGESADTRQLNQLVEKVAQSKASTVLIQGESGTGKSLVAKVIHYASNRADKPFIEVNCTALPESLLESELFGHEKGAFTDAKRSKEGLFELADRGTLFLDEIGDMSLAMQSKLLRAIEEKSFRRVGGTKDIVVDIRIIAATNKDLERIVREGSFREDLYYRIKVMPIFVTPLRERKKDVLNLVFYFLGEFNREFSANFTQLTPEVENMLLAYDWPGNVREVRNVIERAMILGKESKISAEHLMLNSPGRIVAEGARVSPFSREEGDNDLTMDVMEKNHIIRVLRETHGNRNKTAKLLAINRTTLYNKIEKYNLDKVVE